MYPEKTIYEWYSCKLNNKAPFGTVDQFVQVMRLTKQKRSFSSDGEKRCSADETERGQASIPKRHEMLIENAVKKLRRSYKESTKK